MNEIRRIELVAPAGRGWAWRDAVTGERGTTPTTIDGAERGLVLLAELRPKGAQWTVERLVDAPLGVALPVAADHDGDGPGWTFNDEDVTELYGGDLGAWTPPKVGEVRTIFHAIDRRTSAARDVGRDGKNRPAVVVSVDVKRRQAALRPVFGTNSAVRRQGTGQRLRAWKEAGMRKPGYLAHDTEVRAFDDIGPRLGELAPVDRKLLH